MSIKYLRKFEKNFNNTRYVSKICGADVIEEGYQITWITWAIIGLINIAIFFSFYSIYVAVYANHDYLEILKILCMFGTGVQGYAKLINAILQKEYFRFIYKEIIEIYATYEKMGPFYEKYLKESISLVKKLVRIQLGIAYMVSTGIIGVPILYRIIFNERIFIMPFFLPYVDRHTNYGYYFTSTVHITCVIFGSFGNMVSDCWCFVFAAHIPLIKNILKCKFHQLNELLEECPKNINKYKSLLLGIFKWHQKYIIYCNIVKNLFFWVIFVQLSTEFISIVCTIVCIFLGVWPAAPVYLIYSFVLFYFHCALGNIVEIANDDVMTIIYDSKWYHLTVIEQKMVIIMLREAQRAEGMSIGGIAPLSLSTALQITKTIYTFSMMLRNFLD